MRPAHRIIAVALPLLYGSAAHASCGSAFCLVNTNWSLQGVWTQPGPHADLRFEYIDQDQPRQGTHDVAVGAIPAHHDEVRTINRNLLASVDYGFDETWGITAMLPVVDRSHTHIHNHHGAKIVETWSFTAPGDMRVMGRYQAYFGAAAGERAGFAGGTAGFTLPTGATDITNGTGAPAERSLQPGTGTTQFAATVYYREALPSMRSQWYVQAAMQVPLYESAGYKPGTQWALDAGWRYDASDALGFNLQLNYAWKGRDAGAQAEPGDSGGRTLAIAPGATWALTPATQLYGFVSVPVYQDVNGVQLTARWSLAAGISVQF
ncbi:MAG: hypothetical protein U1F48_11155 [Burkholderiales bacterium]